MRRRPEVSAMRVSPSVLRGDGAHERPRSAGRPHWNDPPCSSSEPVDRVGVSPPTLQAWRVIMLIAASTTSARQCDAFRRGPIRPGFGSKRALIKAVAGALLIRRPRICLEGDSHIDGTPLRLRVKPGFEAYFCFEGPSVGA